MSIVVKALDEDTLEESQNLADLISNHYAKLRERIRLAQPPCVPYLGFKNNSKKIIQKREINFKGDRNE